MNTVNLIGNLTKDPTYREGYKEGEGMSVCSFTVAVSDGYGEKEQTSFIPVTVFGRQADSCNRFLSKGKKVGVTGRIQTGSYEKDGRKIYTTDVIASRVEFLTAKGNDENSEKVAVRDADKRTDGFAALSEGDFPPF